MVLDLSEERLARALGGSRKVRPVVRDLVEEIVSEEEGGEEKVQPVGSLKIDYKFDSSSELSEGELLTLNLIEEYLKKFGDEYYAKMSRLISDYRGINPKFTRLIEDKMKLEGYLFPRLAVYHGESARDFVSNLSREEPTNIDEDDFVLAFNFPKPVARFWYKGGRQFGGGVIKDVPEGVVEWGYFYRGMIELVQEWLHNYHATDFGLKIERLSLGGDHNKDKYYYVFQLWKKR